MYPPDHDSRHPEETETRRGIQPGPPYTGALCYFLHIKNVRQSNDSEIHRGLLCLRNVVQYHTWILIPSNQLDIDLLEYLLWDTRALESPL